MHAHEHLTVSRDGVVGRRGFLTTAGVAAMGLTGLLKARADELKKNDLAVILLFMQGAPSQFETWDPKPGTKTGGDTKAIKTAVAGIDVAEFWGDTAKQMKDVALIRSMTGREGNHQRAQYLMHTAYAPAGSVKYPSLGAVAAKELGDPKFDLPHYVSVGATPSAGAGFLGQQYAPYAVGDPNRMPLNSELPPGLTPAVLKRRLALMGRMEKDFADGGGEALVADHRALNETAARMALSPHLKAFDLGKEKDAVRDAYGRTNFGQGCLLARRLVETGVTFVQVSHGNWDTHRNNHDGQKALSNVVDPGFASLVRELKERGRLDKTLVIWMGEFGRTPTINGNAGRDHYPRAFSVALAGGGVKGGQVIGSTNANGTDVSGRPVTVPDLFCSVYQALKINPRKQNQGDGRPIRLVEGGTAVKELF
ncbi:MAG: DUF1501 domain-containing protein [Gemmataceae bacterium]